MKILVACEESQRVCTAFREKGHNAFSCDILPCSGGHPEWHIQGDVLPLLNPDVITRSDCQYYGFYFKTQDGIGHKLKGKWDLIIAHPPCTYLTNAGTRHYSFKMNTPEKVYARMALREEAADFFMQFVNADCERIAIENPIGIMSKKWRKPDQIIQPWWFGDNVGKSTCLWLKGLPLLNQEVTERPPVEYHNWVSKDGKQKRQEMWFYETRCLPHSERGKAASKTFPGIARAMAEQWAGPCKEE